MSQDRSEHRPSQALRARDSDVVMRPWAGSPPVPVVRGRGCVVTDADGKEYLDFTSGYFVNQAGHSHPRVIEAAVAQMHQVMQVSGKQATPASIALAERLVAITPAGLDKAFFATGGSEAVEFALRIARVNKGGEKVAYLDNAYHGMTLGALEVCANESYRASAGVSLSEERTVRLPTPYCYRCPHADDCQTQCLDEAQTVLDGHPDTVALIAEPMQAVGGIIPPRGWWQRMGEMLEARGMALILDEIQTGLGRTGTMFAAERYQLAPDIMAAGKGLSGGVGALSVVLASSAMAATFRGGTTPTNAANAVSAAAGLALVDTIADEGLLDNCQAMEAHLRVGLETLDDPWIGDIRLVGLFGGVELVIDRADKVALPRAAMDAVQGALEMHGALVTVTGPLGNVLRLQPPLTITAPEIDAFVVALDRALAQVREAP